jgi:AraC-like DNA-binding protein
MEEAAALVLAEVAGHLGTRALQTSPAIVDRARRALAEDLGERLTLAELARRVHASPYHLARVFKGATGSTVHGYREGLRLRAAADRAVAGHRLSEVAADLGFASHSHLTARFRRRFGVPPSTLT